MERKELIMAGKRPLTADGIAVNAFGDKRGEGCKLISSPSELFERLNQAPVNHAPVHREITSAEFLEVLRKQVSRGHLPNSRSTAADGNPQGSPQKNHSMHNMEKNQLYHNIATDLCDIYSSVDYGGRDYYRPSTHTSETSYKYEENDESYMASIDSRGNLWEGSLYY